MSFCRRLLIRSRVYTLCVYWPLYCQAGSGLGQTWGWAPETGPSPGTGARPGAPGSLSLTTGSSRWGMSASPPLTLSCFQIHLELLCVSPLHLWHDVHMYVGDKALLILDISGWGRTWRGLYCCAQQLLWRRSGELLIFDNLPMWSNNVPPGVAWHRLLPQEVVYLRG